jgi:3-oxoacyl-[acyl-carrier-protein] synthase III
MAVFQTRTCSIAGISAAVPANRELNSEYQGWDEAGRELFIQTTGISERRVASHGICTSDLCFSAAQKLLQELEWNPESIDLLVFVSQSPDYFLPATSILLHNRLGLGSHAMAFDINLGCSGYVYGMSVVSSLFSNPGINRALLLVGDVSTPSVNPKDKTTYPLFGDAGTATALERGDVDAWFNLQSDGKGKDAIIIPGCGTRNPLSDETYREIEIEPGVVRHQRDLHLDGMEVFSFALREVKPNIEELIRSSGSQLGDFDHFIMHQANRLMNESVRKKLKFPAEKTPYSLNEFGNTSSASIPLTIVTRLQDQLRSKNNKLLLSGFGVGFSWGSAVVSTNHLVIPDLIEI